MDLAAVSPVASLGEAAVACPHNRVRRSVTEVHITLSELGWHHVCVCCENWFVDRTAKQMELCRRCRGPAVHGWR